MLELLTGTGLALAAGLNAWIPLVLLGALDRFTGLVELPPAWSWLANEWVLGVLAVLLLVELVADKIPAVDAVNDVVQTVVRPTAGGIVFGSGTTATTVAVTDPAAFFASNQWVPIAVGAAIALVVHLAKAGFRQLANAATAGFAAPLLSAGEDAGSLLVAVLAVVVPVLVVIAIAGLVVAIVVLVRRRRRRNAGRPAPEGTGLP